MNAPKWDGQRWRIRVMREGKTFSFSSSVPGPKGRKEVQKKYDKWYYDEGSGEKSVYTVSKEFLEDVKRDVVKSQKPTPSMNAISGSTSRLCSVRGKYVKLPSESGRAS